MNNYQKYTEHHSNYYSKPYDLIQQGVPPLQLNQNTQVRTNNDGKLHQLKNFVGMLLEELRYSCSALKDDVFRDRQQMLQDFRQASFSLRQLGQKIQESELEKKLNSNSDHTNELLFDIDVLRQQNARLSQALVQNNSNHERELEKIKYESYMAFQQNFVLNQRITSLQTQLSTQSADLIEDLKKQHDVSMQILNHQIQGLQQTLKQRQESISILERLVKDYELQEKRSNKAAYENDHSKVLNMLSMESYDSKRKGAPLRSGIDSFNNSQIADRYQLQKQKSMSRLNYGNQQYKYADSPYVNMPSPIGKYNSNIAGYQSNRYQLNSHSGSATNLNTPKHNYGTVPHYTQTQIPQYDKIDNHISSLQYSSNVIPPKPPRHVPSRVGSRNDYSTFSSSNKIGAVRQSSIKSRDNEGKRSRDQRKDSKVDLSRIEQQLEGLSRELKSQLQIIGRKK